MSGFHRIRLQAAWSVTADGRVWTRSFGRPTGVATADRVWIVIDRPAARRAVLNGVDLPTIDGRAAAWRHDVTTVLKDRNELRLEFVGPGHDTSAAAGRRLPDALGVVAIEIETGG